MSKLPFFQFYPNDWLRDTGHLSPKAKSIWIDLLCLAWNEPQRGVFKRTVEHFCNQFNLTQEDFLKIIKELGTVGNVTLGNENVTLVSRRMRKFALVREYGMNRVRRLRMKRKCNANVTPKTLDVKTLDKERKEEEKKESAGQEASPPALPERGLPPPAQEPTDPHYPELALRGKCPCFMCWRKIGMERACISGEYK